MCTVLHYLDTFKAMHFVQLTLETIHHTHYLICPPIDALPYRGTPI